MGLYKHFVNKKKNTILTVVWTSDVLKLTDEILYNPSKGVRFSSSANGDDKTFHLHYTVTK